MPLKLQTGPVQNLIEWNEILKDWPDYSSWNMDDSAISSNGKRGEEHGIMMWGQATTNEEDEQVPPPAKKRAFRG